MSHEYIVAGLRGIGGAFIAAGSAFFVALGAGVSLETAGVLAGGAAFTYLSLRFGIEGTIDTQRAKSP